MRSQEEIGGNYEYYRYYVKLIVSEIYKQLNVTKTIVIKFI